MIHNSLHIDMIKRYPDGMDLETKVFGTIYQVCEEFKRVPYDKFIQKFWKSLVCDCFPPGIGSGEPRRLYPWQYFVYDEEDIIVAMEKYERGN